MRTEFILLLTIIALTGCQTAKPLAPLPPPATAMAAPSLELQEKVLRQQQHIQALIAQNEALQTRVRDFESAAPTPVALIEPPIEPTAQPEPVVVQITVPPPTPSASPPTVAQSIEVVAEPEPALMPNADGVIDLAAALTEPGKGEQVNPFAVRSLPADAVREITIHVTGTIAGTVPCALVNDRPMQPGESVESLALVRIETNSVLFRHGNRLLRLPVSEKPARLRLAL